MSDIARILGEFYSIWDFTANGEVYGYRAWERWFHPLPKDPEYDLIFQRDDGHIPCWTSPRSSEQNYLYCECARCQKD